VDNWLRHIQDVRHAHASKLEALPDAQRAERLCELNVIEQVLNLSRTSILEDAWTRGQAVSVHGWIYGVGDGLLRNLEMTATSREAAAAAYASALSAL
jgi:carbonic anhydrase